MSSSSFTTTKRRQSSSYSDELSRYEFVDYTSVSNFEKFVSTIEETLHSWGIKDGSFGIFSTEQLENHTAAIQRHPTAQELTRRETLVMGEEAFQLTYHCHPFFDKQQGEEEFPLAAEHFYQFGHANYHPLHRWIGQDKILILTPNNDSIKKKIFNAAGGKSVVDIYQAKQLISACSIAFQNVVCRVPVFVPVGQSRHDMYMGYMLNTGTDDKLNETEVRFNMSLTTPPTSQLSYLDGLKTLFLQKLCVHYEDYGKPGDMNENVWISAVYTYNLKNWFDENWKNWDEWITIKKEDEPVIKRKSSFSDDFESWGDDDDVVDDSDTDIATNTTSTADHKHQKEQQHQLQFGSFNDPLRSLTLSALFPLSQDKLFDDAYQTNMDALTAKQWQIAREFAPVNQQRGFLSTLLEQVIDSWIKDPTNKEYLAPFDDSNDDSTSDSMSLMRNLFVPGNINPMNSGVGIIDQEQQDRVNFFKSDHVDNVMNLLFHSFSPLLKEDDVDTSGKDDKDNTIPPTTRKLGLRLKTGSSVPYRSFLWNLLLYSLEETSSFSSTSSSTTENNNNNGNIKRKNITNFIGFLKIIWIEVLRKIRWHWENLIPIPDLDPYLYDASANTTDSTVKPEDRALGIDFRYNILHQKISMVNCCIHRRLQNAPQNGNVQDMDHLVRPARRHVGSLFDDLSKEHEQQQQQNKSKAASKFHSLLEKFVEGSSDNSNSNSNSNSEKIKAENNSVSFDVEEEGVSEESDVFLDAIEEGEITSEEGDEQQSTPKNNNNTTTMAESFVSLPQPPTTNTLDEVEATAAAIKDPKVAEGQSHTHPTLKLLKTGEPMQIPITQDPGFMTEDMISERADYFETLGTSEDATQKRAKLQSEQLYSDMQAFKAANPFAILEDFVRWHSPKDWIDGQLSKRMSEPNNIWQELWNTAERVPCERQKPLFNMAVEAEKALYFLETTTIHEFFSIMLPTLGQISYDTLSSHPIVEYSKHVSNGLIRLSNELIEFPWDELRHGKRTFDQMITLIRQEESLMCHAISLLRKLPGQFNLVDQLLYHDQSIVKEGDERASVFQLFRNDQGIISKPSFREYVLYSDCKDLTTNDRVLPTRQYAIVKDNEIRILDMQTTDALYS